MPNKTKNNGTYTMGKSVVGKRGMYRVAHQTQGAIQVPVKILDYKFAWGSVQFLVEPIGGKGHVWATNVEVPV